VDRGFASTDHDVAWAPRERMAMTNEHVAATNERMAETNERVAATDERVAATTSVWPRRTRLRRPSRNRERGRAMSSRFRRAVSGRRTTLRRPRAGRRRRRAPRREPARCLAADLRRSDLAAAPRATGLLVAAKVRWYYRKYGSTEGIDTAAEVEKTVAALRDFTEDARSLISLPRVFQVWGTRAALPH
jgi:hypothetical protein